MKMSATPLVSPGTRLPAWLATATLTPSGRNAAWRLWPSPCAPAALIGRRVTAPVTRSLTKMSVRPLVSPATRLSASLANATLVPSGEKIALKLSESACAPDAAVETRVIAPLIRSLTKMS